MPQLERISRNNTTIRSNEVNVVVTLHGTDIVTYNDVSITLYTGGYNTATTRNRMNQVSNERGLEYRVTTKDGQLYVSYRGTKMPFDEIIKLYR